MTFHGLIQTWYHRKGWHPYQFQLDLADAYSEGYHGLLNAPTGSGKTYAMFIPVIANCISTGNPPTSNPQPTTHNSQLKVLWITPLRALAKDIRNALQHACDTMDLKWRVEIRTGDVSASIKQRQKISMPEVLIITPESLHVLFCSRGYTDLFKNLETIVVDEWHELLGSKRGVQVELSIAKLKSISHNVRIWGISATIGNLMQALEVLVGNDVPEEKITIIRSNQKKEIQVTTVLPDSIEVLPWAGHIGLKLLPQIVHIIHRSTTTLVFSNTRAMAEIWYHHILGYDENLAGLIAMHHGSLSSEVREWVENALHEGTLKAVICTSSLDLGVDFRPVDTVIQIGSPKGVARFAQRAGRSGHQPGAVSKIYFIPTHALELVEISAVKEALKKGIVEKREPYIMCFDVLVQYLVTLSIGEGFIADDVKKEIQTTHAYHLISDDEWTWALQFITQGGSALNAYDEFARVGKKDGVYRIINRMQALRHKMQIGTIVSDPVVRIAYLKGGSLGTIEEYYISKLKPGDVFWFAGLCLEFIMFKEMTAYVRKTKEQKAGTASYMGGRVPLSSYMAELMRMQLEQSADLEHTEPEYQMLNPLLRLQQYRSAIPNTSQLLVELCESKDGHHIFFYPFEGRMVHEIMASLTAYRLSRIKPVSISVAMNDYGFELLCNEKIDIDESVVRNIFNVKQMEEDVFNSVNATEMAKRKFRDIAIISGMIFQGYPGELKRARHLQSSTQLLFDVLRQYEPQNLLLKQSFDEILHDQMEHARLRTALLRIQHSEILIYHTKKFSPFAFPIVVDSLREKLTSEKLADRIQKMVLENQGA